jgi:DNA mismatch repair protein MutL
VFQPMARIHQLPVSVITKIAAGEVIERPASVVKELLENAIDAGSRRITVDIEQGGMELIRVVDDGCGIPADDLPLAFASHATSKLANADDLFRIGTLGFRGEALASIGGVGQVTLQSRAQDEPHGAEIGCQGGEIGPIHPWNGSTGTRIEVRHLFYNTPVRRKFMRTTATEVGHVCEIFTRLALAHPDVHFILRHNGKGVHEVLATTPLVDRLALFFGTEMRERLYEVEARQGQVSLTGFVADPSNDRGNAKLQYFYVNRRWVRDRSLGHALQEAYRGLLMTGRYAVAFLSLDLPPDHVDVNVHPTKVEIRFRDSGAMHQLVLAAVRERLRAANLTPRLQPPANVGGWPSSDLLESKDRHLPFPTSSITYPPETVLPWDRKAMPGARTALMDRPAVTLAGDDAFEPAPMPANPAPEFKAIQLHDCYLVMETQEGMLVIDQHALHERILFEELKERLRRGNLEKQVLLIPQPVELPAEQAARLLEHREALAELGLDVEDFGGSTVLLTSYPAILGKRDPQKVLRLVVDHLVGKERVPTREHLLNDVMSLMACHAAVRAGDPLAAHEIAALLARRELANDTHHCPHGRPTSLLFTRHELERQFRRV